MHGEVKNKYSHRPAFHCWARIAHRLWVFLALTMGYLLTILYLGYFGSVSVMLLRTHGDAVYLGNLIWSVLVILYLAVVRKRFQAT